MNRTKCFLCLAPFHTLDYPEGEGGLGGRGNGSPQVVVPDMPLEGARLVTLYQAYLAYQVAKKAHKLYKKVRQIQRISGQRRRKAMPTKKQCGKGWCMGN